MKLKIYLFMLFMSAGLMASTAGNYQLLSPGGQVKVSVEVGKVVTYSVVFDGVEAIAPSPVTLELEGGETLGENPKLKKTKKKSVDESVSSPLYKKNAVRDCYNEMEFSFKGDYKIVFRAYDDGVAYRFITGRDGDLVVKKEIFELNLPENYEVYAPYVKRGGTFEQQFFNSFENTYVKKRVTELDNKRLIFLPMLIELPQGKKMVITEADLEDYPGLYLLGGNGTSNCLKGVHAPAPAETKQGGHNELQQLVTKRHDYIAKTEGNRPFPWRIFSFSRSDKDLTNNDMVYRLASPSRVSDVSWIKPGKVAWDWWNDWNLAGVDFRAGVNNDTYKYYIDFAAKHGIEYVILDEGWAVNKKADLMQVIPEIDLKELVEYGKARNVGIILWAGYWAFHRDMEKVVKYFADLGVKGFKIDFLDRDDQEMVRFIYDAAELCARYQMMIDYHGVFKPTGLQRTYPNVINYEGVNGLEQLKWSDRSLNMVEYDVTIPFIRMVAGPMDYTQGAMRNANYANYYPSNSEPMSQGTRCHQLATYVIFDSPFNMLCDSPTNYMKEEESTTFISAVPTVWDETVALDGKIAEYVAMARRNGDVWYVGALTNWKSREITLDLSFLGDGNYRIEWFADGINADRRASDYKRTVTDVPSDRKVKVKLAPGGGFAARITKK